MDGGALLALDLATVTGWAVCQPDYRSVTLIEAAAGQRAGSATYGSHRIAPPGLHLGAFLDRFDLWLSDMITAHAPIYLVFEAPILRVESTAIDTARKLMCLAGLTELVAHRRQIPIVREVHLQEVKKHWAGNGRADKRAMIEAGRDRGFHPRDDNAADALAVMDLAASIFFKNRSAA